MNPRDRFHYGEEYQIEPDPPPRDDFWPFFLVVLVLLIAKCSLT